MTHADEAEIGQLIKAFALATDRAVPREMAALMCADEAESFLDNVAEPDSGEPDSVDVEPVEVLGVRIFGDLALARITRPSLRSERTLFCRKECGAWTICIDVENELSLEQLDGEVSRAPAEPETPHHVHDLRRQPLGSLSAADIRTLLMHNEGLDHLLPRVAPQLRWDPLVQASSHPGDLLMAVLGVDAGQWSKDPISLVYVRSAIDALRGMDELDTQQAPYNELRQQIEIFEAALPR